MDIMPLAFGEDGLLREILGIAQTLAPIHLLLREGNADNFPAAIRHMQSIDSIDPVCSALQEQRECFSALFDALGHWIDEVADCCFDMTKMVVPEGKTWPQFLNSLYDATFNVVCAESSESCSAAQPASNKRCGDHMAAELTAKLATLSTPAEREAFFDSYLAIPDGPESCKAYSGTEFTTSMGKRAILVDFTASCAGYAREMGRVVSSIPLVQEIVDDLRLGAKCLPFDREENKCYSYAYSDTSCDCSSSLQGEGETRTSSAPRQSSVNYIFILSAVVVSALSI